MGGSSSSSADGVDGAVGVGLGSLENLMVAEVESVAEARRDAAQKKKQDAEAAAKAASAGSAAKDGKKKKK